MKNIFKIIIVCKPFYRLFFLIAFLILIQAGLELISPVLTKFIVDEIILQISEGLGNINKLILLVSFSFITSLLGIIFASFSNRLGDHLAGQVRRFLTEIFYEKILTLPQSYFDTEISGKIVNQLNRGITTIQGFLNNSTNFILPLFLQSIFTVIVMARFSLPIALFTFALFPIYLSLSYIAVKKWGFEEEKKNKIEDYTRGRITEVISNIKLVKSFISEAKEYNNLSHNLIHVNKIYSKQSNTFHIFDFLRNLSLQLILLFISLIVFYQTFKGQLSVGDMVLILTLFNQARRPLFATSFILTSVQTADSGSKEFFYILGLKSREKLDRKLTFEKLTKPRIEFKNVSFAYETSDIVLKRTSFKIEADEKVALVGHSGVGKTTIVNLILKLYEPSGGNILLKNKSYKHQSSKTIRGNIALVFQENELFSSTIYENVAYGNQSVKKIDVVEALKKANAWEFVKRLPKGINSEVGERGIKLSGGQKQRIQIARAILKNAPILILDEATSSLDAQSEREVQIALDNLIKGRLVIIIAHRFSTIQNVDKILVIENGKVSDSGSPGELAQRKGLYKDLLQYQIEGNRKLLEKFELY